MSTESPSPPDLAVSRHGQIAEAFETFALGMGPFIDERMKGYFPDEFNWAETAANRMGRPAEHGATDPLFQLLVLRRFWGPVFAEAFGKDLRAIIGQIIEARNLWAHFSLPDETAYLDNVLLSLERVLAPVAPERVSRLRQIRTSLKNPHSQPEAFEPATAGYATGDYATEGYATELQVQLGETESAFNELQGEMTTLTEQLERSRRAAAAKQLRIASIERQLQDVHGRSTILQTYLDEERSSRSRMEWLFVGFITVMLLVMVLTYFTG